MPTETGLADVLRPSPPARRRQTRPRSSATLQNSSPRLRVLLTTEGTYPYVTGGVSSWCQLLLSGLDEFKWSILPIVAGSERRTPKFDVPRHGRVLPPLELWSETSPTRSGVWYTGSPDDWLPAALARDLLGWHGDLEALTRTLSWCHDHPRRLRRAFRASRGWRWFLESVKDILRARPDGAPRPPDLNLYEASQLYQALYWVARTAAAPLPGADIVHATAAGWSAIPALLHRERHGTPVLLTEHGLYVREAYLAAVQQQQTPGVRFIQTRLARGMARLAYASADVIAPVTHAHSAWEESFGVPRERIRVIVNGVAVPDEVVPPPQRRRVVSVGRIDPLKDLATMLLVADRVRQAMPDVEFRHYGPVSDGQEAYATALRSLHSDLGLGGTFAFMGSTSDPHGVVRQADVVLMTSISEGLPMAILEAMAQARPVVATTVGGVSDTVRGCGLTAPPGDVDGLASSVLTLLQAPGLARRLGEQGHRRVVRRYQKDECLAGYGSLIADLAAGRLDGQQERTPA